MNVRIEINGLKEFGAACRKEPEFALVELGNAVKTVVRELDQSIRREAPVNKGAGGGTLRQKIRSKMDGPLAGRVTSEADYSACVEFGTRPHDIYPRTKKALAWTMSMSITGPRGGKSVYKGKAVYAHVHHPGTRPNPFFTRGIEGKLDRINEIFNKALENILKKVAK